MRLLKSSVSPQELVKLPKLKLRECVMCGALFPFSARLLCWKHQPHGSVPQEILDGDTGKLPID